MYISGNCFNWLFKCNILGKMIVLHNRCINIYPEMCTLSQIPKACHKMCNDQIECFPASSRTRSLGEFKSKLQPNPAHFGHNNFFKNSPICHYLFQGPPIGLTTSNNLFQKKSFQQLTSISHKYTTSILVKRTAWQILFYGQMKLDITNKNQHCIMENQNQTMKILLYLPNIHLYFPLNTIKYHGIYLKYQYICHNYHCFCPKYDSIRHKYHYIYHKLH